MGNVSQFIYLEASVTRRSINAVPQPDQLFHRCLRQTEASPRNTRRWQLRTILTVRGRERTTTEVVSSKTSRARGPRKPAGAPPACSLLSGRTRPQALRAAFLKQGETGHPRPRRVS